MLKVLLAFFISFGLLTKKEAKGIYDILRYEEAPRTLEKTIAQIEDVINQVKKEK